MKHIAAPPCNLDLHPNWKVFHFWFQQVVLWYPMIKGNALEHVSSLLSR